MVRGLGLNNGCGWSRNRAGAILAVAVGLATGMAGVSAMGADLPRERLSIDAGWRFTKDDPAGSTVSLLYDVRPAGRGRGGRGGRGAPASQPATDAAVVAAPPPPAVIKQWILPTGNDFLKDVTKWAVRPEGNLGDGVPYLAGDFDDSAWKQLDLPHDWGTDGPFMTTGGGAQGRLPFYGIGWYRKKLDIPAGDAGKSIFLDVDGAMAYATVWLNGKVVGGWPYGYASWRVDLTPYAKPGGENQLAIRLDNPPNSSRWYPGGGIYRNVWLVTTSPVHVGQWGTYVTTPEISAASATVNLRVTVDNNSKADAAANVTTRIFALDEAGNRVGDAVATIAPASVQVGAGKNGVVEGKATVANPKLWGPAPEQKPNRYVAVTTVQMGGNTVDSYETPFGIRTLKFDPDAGFFINGQHVKINGVCDHLDLGSLGTAVNHRALERQLQMLVEMGCNAIRTSHNPPTPELIELADQMGIMVMDETFDTWRSPKTPLDYNLLFKDWHEQDTRMLVRRDRNSPSVILWSIGNEIGEQGQGAAGAAVAKELCDIVHEEDPTRLTTSACNGASPGSPFAATIDAVGLNYQGSRPTAQYPDGTYPAFHRDFPNKFVFGSETASTISTRGEYTFPVATGNGAVSQGRGRGFGGPGAAGPAPAIPGQDTVNHQMSSYDLYYPGWATSPDTEFTAQDKFPFVGGEFVWTGWDYIGEPTPFDATSRSSYFGIIDLAGFKKDRFYLYQAHWRPDFAMAHILPHWNWPDRVGQVTPVHVYTSGDEAELFLNGKSLGRKKKGQYEYRLRWDDVVYEPGELKVVAYKGGKEWATDDVKTTGAAAKLLLKPDHATIKADGQDLSFVTLTVADADGLMVPRTHNLVHFTISGPADIVTTDNGDPTDMTIFASPDRKVFNGLALAIVRPKAGAGGTITVTAKSDGLADAVTTIVSR